jgi:hypothetical protein
VSQSSALLTVLDNVTGTESAGCMNDPRYMTWRLMTIRLKINGEQVWWRTDSYWNSSATSFSSTWGPGIAMSTHWISGADNNGSTNIGKTFVFAYGDGSGIQLNHLTFGATAATGAGTASSGGTN